MTFKATVLVLCLAPIGCDAEADEEQDEGELVATVSTSECASGRKWIGGNEESARMHPGGDCIGCHADMNEGPTFGVAGTVYADLGQATDCFGVADAVVEITDANGTQWALSTNAAGNFWLDEDENLALPYRAKVMIGNAEIAMATAQNDGSCASCHTASGANNAAGRIIGP